jgi:hypothetical protein
VDDLRRVVREELATLSPASAGGPARNESQPASEAPSEEQASAATQAGVILDAALSRRTWTEGDREALQPHFVLMAPAQRDQWLQRYAQAVNLGRLEPDSERPPF